MPHFPLRAPLLLFAAMALGAPALAQAARVPGTGVGLVPPSGFAPAKQFSGFQNPEADASIVVTEIAGPVSEVLRGMTRSGLASRGMELIESRTVTLDGREALLLHVSQSSQGADFFKWMLVGGSAKRTFMVVGTFPAEASDLSDSIRQSLLSATWEDAPRTDLLEGLAFSVESTPGMRFAERMGNLLILTETGRIAPGKPDIAILVLGSSMSDVEIGDLERYSRQRLLQTDRMKGLNIRSGTAVRIDSLAGYEVIADGQDAETGRPVGVYQVLLRDGKTYYIAQGFAPKARMGTQLPVFRQVTGSFRRRVEMTRPRITQ